MMITRGISLKTYAAEMAGHLGITPMAAYERQRVLVRLGELPSVAGRGPNSGVRATPTTVAALLIAGLFADNLSEIDERFVRLLNAKPTEMERRLEEHTTQLAHFESGERQWRALGRKALARTVARARPAEPAKLKCLITGAGNFRNAVAALLASEALASEVECLIINRSLLVGIISARDGRVSEFGTARSKKPRMEVVARFPGELVIAIASELPILSTTKVISS